MDRIYIISILFFSMLLNYSMHGQSSQGEFSFNAGAINNLNVSFFNTDISNLIDFKLETLQFDSYEHTQKIVKQVEKFNLFVARADDQRDGWITLPIGSSDKWYFKDYYIDYQRSTLKRLLPQPPDIWFLNHRGL